LFSRTYGMQSKAMDEPFALRPDGVKSRDQGAPGYQNRKTQTTQLQGPRLAVAKVIERLCLESPETEPEN
jgi:hypothetical protein